MDEEKFILNNASMLQLKNYTSVTMKNVRNAI